MAQCETLCRFKSMLLGLSSETLSRSLLKFKLSLNSASFIDWFKVLTVRVEDMSLTEIPCGGSSGPVWETLLISVDAAGTFIRDSLSEQRTDSCTGLRLQGQRNHCPDLRAEVGTAVAQAQDYRVVLTTRVDKSWRGVTLATSAVS